MHQAMSGFATMKKLSEKRRLWLVRNIRHTIFKRTKRKMLRKGLLSPARTMHRRKIPIRIDCGGQQYRGYAYKRIPMPQHLCFENHYEETAKCIEMIRQNLHEGEEAQAAGHKFDTLPTYHDFACVKSCSPSAALALAAEFDKSRSIREFDIPLIDINRWNRHFKRMLDDIGFFRLLNIARPERGMSQRSEQTMQFQTGRMVGREDVAAITDRMIELLTDEFPLLGDNVDFQTTCMRMLGAIQEATENSCDHAYRNSDVLAAQRKWWATGYIDVGARHLNLVVYDQGNTIPRMLPNWDKYPFVESRLARFERAAKQATGVDELDAIKMRLAMDVPTSSTEKEHRGKGFVLFREVVDESPHAKILIFSRRGKFVYQKGGKRRAEALKTPLNGTLVEWDLWL